MHYKKLFKNSFLLLSGDSISAIFAVFTFAATARALGTEVLGMLVLIDTYVRIVDKLVNSQSWQYMIKYGSDALEKKDYDGFKALVKMGVLVDLGTAFLGFLVSVSLAGVIASWQNWPAEMERLAFLYSSIILFNIAGVPTGVLRLFNQFKLFSVQKSVCSIFKFLGAVMAWYFDLGLTGFVWVWMLTEILDYLSLTLMAWHQLHRAGIKSIWEQPLAGVTKKYPGLIGFLISTNLTGSVKVGFREFDILFVGKLLGFTDVGLYKMAKKLCAILDRTTNPLFQSLYPELSRIWAKQDYDSFKKMGRHFFYILSGISAAMWIAFIFTGQEILRVIAGLEFVSAYSVTLWYLLANGMAIATLPYSAMLLAMGKANLSFWIQFIPTLIYFPILYGMILIWGINGAAYAFIVFQILRAGVQQVILRQQLIVSIRT